MNTSKRTRKKHRLPGYDYACNGFYHITICAASKEVLFASIDEDALFIPGTVIFTANPRGRIVLEQWTNLPSRFPGLTLDEYSLLPDHFHGIVLMHQDSTQNSVSNFTVGDVICAFKSITTKLCNQAENKPGRKIWERNYHDRVIRDEQELEQTREYVRQNPIKWKENEHYLFTNQLV